jgi:hypothetical protein
MGLSSAARAADETLLPWSLSEPWAPADRGIETADPGELPGLSLRSLRETAADSPPWISISGSVGALLMDTSFDAVGTDLAERQVRGIGTGLVDLEVMVPVHLGWRVGVAGEVDFWKDLQILGGGPVVSYRLATVSSGDEDRPDVEHLLKAGILYQSLAVTKSGFGRFDSTVTVRAGYELRIAITPEWYLVGDAELRYGAWTYKGSVMSGDTRLGGVAGVLSIGIAWVP